MYVCMYNSTQVAIIKVHKTHTFPFFISSMWQNLASPWAVTMALRCKGIKSSHLRTAPVLSWDWARSIPSRSCRRTRSSTRHSGGLIKFTVVCNHLVQHGNIESLYWGIFRVILHWLEFAPMDSFYRQLGEDWTVKPEVQQQLEQFTCIMYSNACETSVNTFQTKMLKKIVREDEKLTTKQKST